MENNNTSSRVHPLVAGAAISVMLVSLTGVAAMTGLIPTSHSSSTPAAAAEASPVATSVGSAAVASSPAALVETKDEQAESKSANAKPAPAEKRASTPRVAHAPAQPRPTYNSNLPAVAQAPAVCYSCGRVESVQAIQQAAQPSGVGMVAGAVLGGVLGNQVGGGNGRKLATVAGAVGGGYAGNEVEKRTRSTTSYQVRVRMEDGQTRTFPFAQQPGWNTGDRVRVVDGQLTARA
ncbi:glycine zipper 2TM domain-containing protein [Noviherbaspirillum saxi]|uniref:Glycine zipper 2TM domain-containing protein n=1 Tax=Noviherbaspirillum saxi TaxID=2320863 RepID=A0A3A3FPZ2_9BURK|nr:glycine zipper 2TM domain-containing protein [Noviherbaspirillum saxi]RJF98272.1 glycine zipper 2TM domain-containing protein [Noviherbaspirillum saxi]